MALWLVNCSKVWNYLGRLHNDLSEKKDSRTYYLTDYPHHTDKSVNLWKVTAVCAYLLPYIRNSVESDDIYTSVCHIEHVADHVVEHHRICIVQIPLVWVKCSHDHLIAVIYPCEVTRRRSWEYLRHSLLIYVRNEPIIIEEISGSCNRISISRCPCPLMILTCMVHYEIQTAAYTLSVTLCSEVLQILHGSKLRLYLSEIRNSISAVISALRAFQQRHKMKIIHTT